MNDSIYISFDKNGVLSMRKSPPNLKGGEFCFRLDIHIDKRYFNRIIPIAKMELDDKFIIEPEIELEAREKDLDKLEDVEIMEDKG